MTELKFGKYRHYKNKLYEVIAIAKHTETLEDLVVYQALYDSKRFGNNAIWARPKAMFMGAVEVGGKVIPRFEYVGE